MKKTDLKKKRFKRIFFFVKILLATRITRGFKFKVRKFTV